MRTIYKREGAANRIHREHPQAMRSQRFVPPTYTMDARRLDERHDYVWPTDRPAIVWREDWPVVLGLAFVLAICIGMGLYGAHGLGWLSW